MSATMYTHNQQCRFLIPFSFIVKTFYISIKLVHFLQSYTANCYIWKQIFQNFQWWTMVIYIVIWQQPLCYPKINLRVRGIAD